MKDDINRLTRDLGYTFNNQELLVEALTHRSASSPNNERLEFLGDGVLNFIIAAELFRRYPKATEGELSRLRACLVKKDGLAKIARGLSLGDYLILGSGELKSGGYRRDSILADAAEAIIGAVYLDQGFETCRGLVLRLYAKQLDNVPDLNRLKDPKTRLQELLQSKKLALPVYEVQEVVGKAHEQYFRVECSIETLNIKVEGKGRSRRKAEQAAAEQGIAAVEGLVSAD